MARVGVISVDGHVRAPWDAYRGYLDPQWREAYDDWAAPRRKVGDFCHPGLGQDAQWDARRRVADLSAQGVVAEVVFPNGVTPFASAGADPAAVRAGYQAYNRWLANLCAEVPGRIYPQALIDFSDVDAAVREVHAARDLGFVGVVAPPIVDRQASSRYFFDPALDPIWAALQETGLPLSQHGGFGAPEYRPQGAASFLVLAAEHWFFSGRSLWQLILGGVFDRFPRLKAAYVETETWWMRPILQVLDARDLFGDLWAKAEWATGAGGDVVQRPYARLPSDYLKTNVFLGISPFSLGQARAIYEPPAEGPALITPDNAMVGVDYPHPETALKTMREGVSQLMSLPQLGEAAARQVIYGNAARVFGIDLSPLQAEIARIGVEASAA